MVARVFHTDVGSLNGSLWRLEAQTDILVPSSSTLSGSLRFDGTLLVIQEDVRLLLESALALDGQLGRHVCCCCDRGRSVVESVDW